MDGPGDVDDDQYPGDGYGELRQPGRVRGGTAAGGARMAGAGADDEQELPGERVEEPDVIGGIGGRRPAMPQRQRVERRRGQERPERPERQGDEHERKDG